MILKWHRYYIFTFIYRPNKIFKVNLVVSEVLITHVTNRGKARAMLAIEPLGNVTNWFIMTDLKILKYCYLNTVKSIKIQ